MKSTLIKITAALLAITSTVSGQSRAWRVLSPCDSSFSVEVPSPLYKVSWFEGKHGAEVEPDWDFDNNKTASYVTLQQDPKTRQFGVVVFNDTGESTAKEREEYRKGIFGGWYFMIGGDDAEPTSQRPIRTDDLLGREYVFDKEIEADTFTRGRIFYADNRLYFVVFRAASAEDLMSPDADRFLNFFHVIRRRTSSKHRVR
jgi:hypothetical protein